MSLVNVTDVPGRESDPHSESTYNKYLGMLRSNKHGVDRPVLRNNRIPNTCSRIPTPSVGSIEGSGVGAILPLFLCLGIPKLPPLCESSPKQKAIEVWLALARSPPSFSKSN